MPAVAPFVIAHRGASARAPENTMLALRAAVEEDGAEGLELDLQLTRDGVVVVLHDETVDRTTDGHGPVREFRFDELRRLDAGARFRDAEGRTPHAGHGVRVPALREVLEAFPGLWMSLDLKRGGEDLEEATVRVVHEHGAVSSVVLSAENTASARRLARRAPELERFFDREAVRAFYLRHRLRCWWGYSPPARSLQIPVRHGRWALDAPRLVTDAHRLGIAVRYWTVNEEMEMERLLALGVDGLITDHPRRLHDLLVRKGLR